ncbi:MAG: ABC transporter permease [Neomegalonema sp.]|nr:ABC transporter permease [Neomegalonema sp.]
MLALSVKELRSLLRDPVLLLLVLHTFTFAIYSVAKGVQTDVKNAAIAIVDEDRSELTTRLRGAFLPPHFKPSTLIGVNDVDTVMDAGAYSFVIHFPAGFERDVLAGRAPTLQINVDATAMTMAGSGVGYIEAIIARETAAFVAREPTATAQAFSVATRARFNPNLDAAWFMAVMQLIQNVTMMGLVLTGAAVIREREHGTIEHLLAMPVAAGEIMLSKIIANGGVIVVASVASLIAVVQILLDIPIAGSELLFGLGAAVYLFSITALGILLSTIARSMQQFGLLCIPVFVVMNMLSGGVTPLDAMPPGLQLFMQMSPSTHYVNFAQAVLYRGAGLDIVWPQLAANAVLGALFFSFGLYRFRASIAEHR